MKNIVLEDVGEFTQVQFKYFSVHYVFRFSPEDKKVMPSKFITKGPIVVLGWGIGRGMLSFGPFDPLCFFQLRLRIIGWTCKAS